MADPPDGIVTLLFTDLESSTLLLRALGDAYAAVLIEHQRLVREAIAAHHGYEVDTQGDAFFVAFARPANAVAAAVAVQRSIEAYSRRRGVEVRVRIGLHTGQPLLLNGRYVGLDVHRAARIAEAAHGGQVLLSHATAALVWDHLEEGTALRDLGAYVLRDFEQPEQLFELVIEGLPSQFPPLRTARLETEELPEPSGESTVGFVNRLDERRRLWNRLAGALAGHGGLVLLAGEPGIGKTRLAEELASDAARRGVVTLWGRCWESEGAPPFWPWIQILRRLAQNRLPLVLRAELGSGASLIAEIVPELRERLPNLPPAPIMEPEAARFQLFDTITNFLGNVARSQPLLLLLDDLHWADKPSLLLLQFLQQHLDEARILLLGAYRHAEVDRHHPLGEVLPSLRRERGFELIALEGLEEDAVGDLIVSFFDQPLTERGRNLARVLRSETEGNPFFVQEELRFLVENERIVLREGIWTSDVTSIAELGLPEAVRQVIDRRLSHLSETSSTLLTEASVIGREFEVATLAQLGEVDELPFELALDEAEIARIVEPVTGLPGRYRFSHALFQEALYSGLPSNRRQRLHRRVGEALEREHGHDLGEHLSQLAYHFVQGRRLGDDDKAIDYARRAGEHALATYAYEEAVRQFETALELLDDGLAGHASVRCALLLKLAEALMRSGGALRVANEVAPQAADLAESLGDSERALQACRAGLQAVRRYASSSSPLVPEYRRWLERAQRHAEPGSPGRLWIDISLQYPRSEGYTAENWHARQDNLMRARSLGDPDLLCRAATSVLSVAPPSRWPEQVRLARQLAHERWEGVSADERSAFDTYCSATLLDGGDREAWAAIHERMRRRGERLRDPYILFWGFFREHGQLLMDGQLSEALAVQTRMQNGTRSAGMQVFGLTNATGPGGRNLIYLGRAAESLALAEEGSQASGHAMDPHSDLAVLSCAHLGRFDDVNAALDWMLTPEGGMAERGIVTIVLYLEAAVLVGHRTAAARLAEILAPASAAATCRVTFTCAARHLGAAATLLGDYEQALAYTCQALEVSGRIQHRPEIALVHLQLAELLLEAGRAQPPLSVSQGPQWSEHGADEALLHLNFAEREFSAMKMQTSLERAQALQRRLLPSMNSPTGDSSR